MTPNPLKASIERTRGKTVEVKCHCGDTFTARVADRKRGWAKSCSKSCAATKTNQKTGNYQRFIEKRNAAIDRDDGNYQKYDDDNWDDGRGHGDNDLSWDGIAGTYDGRPGR